MLGYRRRHEPERSHSPALVRPLARLAFLLLAAGFTLVAVGVDPVAVTAGGYRWLTGTAPTNLPEVPR